MLSDLEGIVRHGVVRWALTCAAGAALVGSGLAVDPASASTPPSLHALAVLPAPRGTAVSTRTPRLTVPAAVPSGSTPLLGGTWQPLGPAPVGPAALAGGGFYGGANSGRVTGLAVIPSGAHAGRVVAGSAGGGLWTTDNDGTTWTPRSDQAPSLAIGSVADDPTHPDHLIAGMGEANQSGDSYPGFGILSSQDGGTTWSVQNPGGVFNGVDIAQVAIDPSNAADMFAATSKGLYVTTNGGVSWALPSDPSYSAVNGNITAVVIDPASTSTIFVGGGGDVVAKSTDGGVHWAAANTGIGAPASGPLVAIAEAASSPSTLYASVGSTSAVATYKSTNGGSSWVALPAPDYTGNGYAYGSGSGEQGWYDNVIAVDPTNANHVLAGGETVVESTDGGSTWTNINGQSFFAGGTNLIHPDQHALAFGAGGVVWTGDDGGVYLYNPSTKAVTNKNGNLDITQFYFGFNEVGGTVLAGSQDNASARTSSPTLGPWTEISAGDGGPSAITPNDPSTQFIEADSGLYATSDAFATDPTNITPPTSGSLFTPPIAVAPSTSAPADPTVFYGGLDLWRTTDPTDATPAWTQVTSVGDDVSAITVDPSNANVVYVGFTNGTIEVSTDGGTTFTAIGAQPFASSFVTGLSVDPSNPKAVTASFSYSDTRYGLGTPYVGQYRYSSSPGLGTWTDITGNLPSFAVSHVVYDHGVLLAATDVGVYGTGSVAGGATAWWPVGTGLPRAQVQDLYVDPTTQDVYAITHGRGGWVLHYAALVTGVSPKAGPLAGGRTVTITGTDLNQATRVTFGTTAGTHLQVLSAGKLLVNTPAHAAGTIEVRVSWPKGESPGTAAGRYTYEQAPTVTAVSPSSGTHKGGQRITIRGTNLTGATFVKFGGTMGINLVVVSSTELTVQVPAHAKGKVYVRVTTPSGTNATSSKDAYTFT